LRKVEGLKAHLGYSGMICTQPVKVGGGRRKVQRCKKKSIGGKNMTEVMFAIKYS